MDPKEYRRIFRNVLEFLRRRAVPMDQQKASADAVTEFVGLFEVACQAEQDSTEALEREVAALTSQLHEARQEILAMPRRKIESEI